MELDENLVQYARTYLEIKIHEKHIAYATKEDEEDIASFCLARLCQRWKNYNPAKGMPKTYICAVLKTALVDALRWHYRQRQRMPFEELQEGQEAGYEETSLYDLIDDLLDDDTAREACKMRLEGYHERQIISNLHISKGEYENALQTLREALRGRGDGGAPPPP